MIRLAACLAAALPCASLPAVAQSDFCAQLSTLQAAAAFPGTEDVPLTLSVMGEDAVACQRVLELGGVRSLSCNWPFPYRSDAAQVAFERLVAAITECRGDPIASDAPVNHPDSYDLSEFAEGINAALKDKAALGETHVILRVQG
jgi:hypothetical protein